jgi:hypothetical protein
MILLVVSVALCGCSKRASTPDDGQAAIAVKRASLVVPQHTGARAGNEPVHVAFVDIDGQRYDLKRGDRTIDVLPGRHEVTASYERCFHAPTQLVRPGQNRAFDAVAGWVAFDAEPGARYVLGCTAGGGGAMIANAHWIDQQLPGGKRLRVADTKAGPDFPAELLGIDPPAPGRSSGTSVAPK